MKSDSRSEILKRIAAVGTRRPSMVLPASIQETDLLKSVDTNLAACFKQELESINGTCVFCATEEDMYRTLKDFIAQHELDTVFCKDPFITEELDRHGITHRAAQSDFESMRAGITGCEFLVARTGSVLVSSASSGGRRMNVFPPIHIIFAHVSQLLEFPVDALNAMQEKYGHELPSAITTVTGPSRTADIEKTLVLGAHGPKELIVFLNGISH